MLRTVSVAISLSLVAAVAAVAQNTTNAPATAPTRDRAVQTGKELQTKAREAVTPATGTKDIVDTAVAAGSFKTLAAALTAAGLIDTLKGSGPFTVFAPTDEAFAKLPAGTVEMLLKPENKAKLVSILTYHVVPAKAMAADVTKMTFATTVQGQRLNLKVVDGKVMVDNATVTKADIVCSNGVIHVIDSVIMPMDGNVLEVARGAGTMNTLLAAIEAAGMNDLFKGPGPFTVLAPNEAAFRALPKGTLEMLLKPENKTKLAEVLSMHVIPGALVYSDAVVTMSEVRPISGKALKVTVKDGKVTIGGATVVVADIEAKNGVIHEIDTVILPPSMTGASATATEKPAAGSN